MPCVLLITTWRDFVKKGEVITLLQFDMLGYRVLCHAVPPAKWRFDTILLNSVDFKVYTENTYVYFMEKATNRTFFPVSSNPSSREPRNPSAMLPDN